ncbi:MAG: response regulator transcription factor [Candidatus Acidiferrales bacterium]
MRVLIIEDEQKVADFIKKGLQQEGYAVDVTRDGQQGAEQAVNIDYDAVILDLMLPKLPGLDVLPIIRARRLTLPVLILTAKGSLEDKVKGLDSGASDYLVKPFAFAELSARIRALLRRGHPETPILRMADLEMNTVTRVVTRGGRRIELKPKEFALLEFLLRNARRPVTRTMIIEHVWDIHFDAVSNVVDVHINSLRSKIDREFPVSLIHTLRGVGYILTDEESC